MLLDESSPVEAPSLGQVAGQSIAAYRVGEKLRTLRVRKKLSLVEAGKLTELSPSMLSQLENGRLIPTLPTLTRIAVVFGVGLDFFFGSLNNSKPFALLKKKSDRLKIAHHPPSGDPSAFFECLTLPVRDNPWQLFEAQFPPGEAHSTPHSHDGMEFLHLLSGQLETRTATGLHKLDAGDSCYFDPSEPHSYRCASPGPASAIVVTAPPRSPY